MILRLAAAIGTFMFATATQAETIAPPVPTLRAVLNAGCTRVQVIWENVDDFIPLVGGSGVAHYSLYRRDSSGTVTFITNSTGGLQPHGVGLRRAFVDVPGHPFDFAVTATDRDGNASGFSSWVAMPVPLPIVCAD